MELQESMFDSWLGKETNFVITENTKILTQWVTGPIFFPGGKPFRN
jgi:hypothetical protein